MELCNCCCVLPNLLRIDRETKTNTSFEIDSSTTIDEASNSGERFDCTETIPRTLVRIERISLDINKLSVIGQVIY